MSSVSNININNYNYKIDLDSPLDISIQINSKQNPSFYDDNPIKIKYFESENKVWSIAHGASCNIPVINLNIHCGMTHTECRSHITKEKLEITSCIKNFFTKAHLISIKPSNIGIEKYHCKVAPNDLIITKEALVSKMATINKKGLKSLIIRTLPNSDTRLKEDYTKKNNSYFSNDAIHYIKSLAIENLIVDSPSIDKFDDGGKLGNHRIFWDLDVREPNKNTITELAYINEDIKDGEYLLSLNTLNIKLDASPSRPVIYKILK